MREGTEMKLYTCSAVDDALDTLIDIGYDCVQVSEGVLGCGHWICIAPDDRHYHFEFQEVYMNEWSSGHTVRKCRTLSNQQMQMIQTTECA